MASAQSGITNVPSILTSRDLAIKVEFTHEYPDLANANLAVIYPSAGEISPNFNKDTTTYTIAVPFGTAEFSISAQAENPYLSPVLTPEGGGGDNLLDADLMSDLRSAENGGPLTEGSNGYR